MSGPFIYIHIWSLKDGKREQARTFLQQFAEHVEKNEPRLIAFNVYSDELGKTIGVVQVHPDAASMETHMKVISDHLSNAFDYIDTSLSEHVYGTPSDALAAMLRTYADPNASTTFLPLHEAGFTRASVG